jgi:undecaprenyl phosphate N,N'-diacetylbacillosamine 1-phosphate transferase
MVRKGKGMNITYRFFWKPFFDRLVSLILLIVLFPVIIIVGGILYFSNDGKIWFVQKRPGYQAKLFHVAKFKTMNDLKDADGNLLTDEKRLTFMGKLIRRTSIDELPQLFNVLTGSMSIVGPRPLLPEYLTLYNDFQKRRHEVKPGITGWAQVNGRNNTTWNDRFEKDIWYVDNQSFKIDLKIIFLTIIKVFRAEGIQNSDSVTMEKFNGD